MIAGRIFLVLAVILFGGWKLGVASSFNLVSEGDSITVGFGAAASYSALYSSSRLTAFHNQAVNGSSVPSLAGREAATNAFLVSTPYVKNILSVMIGLNDFVAGNSVAVVESEWKSYMTAEKAAGWTTICITVLPTDPAQTGSGGTLINTLSAQFNSDMKGFPVGQYCDYISDFRADPVMGPNTAPNNSTLYFSDKQHPTTLGQQNLAAIYAATLNAIHP